MRRLLLVRHGETDLNAKGHFVSSNDPDLSDLGREQAERLSRSLAAVPLDLIVTSPMRRCRRTAAIIARYQSGAVEIREDARLKELGFGALEGLDKSGIESRGLGDTFRAWRQGVPVLYPAGAETFEAAADRIGPVLREVGEGGGTVMFVGHSHSLRILLASEVLFVPPEVHRRLRLEHATITEVQWEASAARIVALNADSVLPG